jgi:hypothetical protein
MESLCSKSEVFDVENNLARIVLTEHVSTKQFKTLVNTLQETGADISTDFSSGEIKVENGLNRVPGEEDSDRVQELEHQLDQKQEQVQSLVSKVEELRADKTALEQNLDEEKREKQDLQETKMDIQSEFDDLQKERDQLQERVDELESKLEEERSGTDSKNEGENLELNGENKDSEEQDSDDTCQYCGEQYDPRGLVKHEPNCPEKPENNDQESYEEKTRPEPPADAPKDSQGNSYYCEDCDSWFGSAVKTRSTHHDCNGENELKNSEKSFNQDPEDQRSLEQESEKEDLENEIECEVCGFEASSEKEFEIHDCEEEAEERSGESLDNREKSINQDDSEAEQPETGAWSDPDLVSDNPIFGLEKYERFECQCGSRFTSDVEAHEHDSECGQYEWRIWFNKLEEVEAAVDIEDRETGVKA